MVFDRVDDAFEEIDEVRDYLRTEGTSLAYDVLSMAEETLKKEFNKREWISVTEKLPERGGKYIVTKVSDGEETYVGTAHWVENTKHWFSVPSDCEIIAWMDVKAYKRENAVGELYEFR